jgi:hypothetical protein
LIGQENLQQQRDDAEHDRMPVLPPADDELQRIAHRRDVGGDVDRVGDHEHRDNRIEHRPREMSADVRSEAMAGHASHPCADHLDPHHQWKREDHRPAELIAELRTGLRVGRDPARIVVGGARDEAGAQLPEPAARHVEHASSFADARSVRAPPVRAAASVPAKTRSRRGAASRRRD